MQVRFRSPCETQNKWFPYIIMQFIKYINNDDGKTQPLVADTLYEGKLQRLLVIFLFSFLRRRRNYSHFPWGVSGQSFCDWALMNFMYYTDILSQVLSESEKKYTHTHTKEKEKEKIPHLSLTVFSTFYIASWEGWLLLEGENDSTWGSSTEEILPRSKTDFAEWPSDGICASSNKPRLEPQARGGGCHIASWLQFSHLWNGTPVHPFSRGDCEG